MPTPSPVFAKLFRNNRLHQDFDSKTELLDFLSNYAMDNDEYVILQPCDNLVLNYPFSLIINAQAPMTNFVVDNPSVVHTLKGQFVGPVYCNGSAQTLICEDFYGQQTDVYPFFKGLLASITFGGTNVFSVAPGYAVTQEPAGAFQLLPCSSLTVVGGGSFNPS